VSCTCSCPNLPEAKEFFTAFLLYVFGLCSGVILWAVIQWDEEGRRKLEEKEAPK